MGQAHAHGIPVQVIVNATPTRRAVRPSGSLVPTGVVRALDAQTVIQLQQVAGNAAVVALQRSPSVAPARPRTDRPAIKRAGPNEASAEPLPGATP
jgi:hypothetical protein